jgi:hypothetical protein
MEARMAETQAVSVEPQSPSSDEILDEIDDRRYELGANLHRLEATVKEKFNPRRYFEERPMDLAILALGAGLYLASRKDSERRVPENREMNDTFASTRDALLALGKRQMETYKGAATAGWRGKE